VAAVSDRIVLAAEAADAAELAAAVAEAEAASFRASIEFTSVTFVPVPE
jgi:nucleotide-binding universal stress UspA family protein